LTFYSLLVRKACLLNFGPGSRKGRGVFVFGDCVGKHSVAVIQCLRK
jgi:hypothetical protein